MRLRLALPVWLLAGPAAAQVCAIERPGWRPTDGRLDALGEALLFVTSPMGVVVLAICAAAFAFRSQPLAVIALVLAAGLALFLATAPSVDPALGRAMAEEGCLGPTWLSAAIFGAAALAVAARLWALGRPPL